MKKSIHIILFLLFLTISNAHSQKKVIKTDAEWKQQLTEKQYFVLRQKGTEYAFSGEYDKHYKTGTYYCAGCNTPLFTSTTKFDSGTGWPSFDNHINNNVAFLIDKKYGMVRTEIICNVCEGHLGHMFKDGPKETTGKRYCVNSASLLFNKK
ncbi:peptide-methionine (R)-S-oxide reductase [Wenyingzhuangia heitensis]|uniref:peptide-methionine (R)-S-oxide reductase n=1 Tax=Wenyingzhuangia heitensis TaxID=1487859 RepID=A0ABX0UBF5_9FLAO|nr:peptide-methionine (R)-S-oxide reductase MsrB [Wenyingzhuangia heitensis]NIJ46153.1 peptide-methionine (R)-S-oxide reductase [Wenyingzhuangia heitensis]